MSKLVTGIFQSRESAELASEELIRAGFAPEDISLLVSETTHGREFAVKQSTKAPEGAAAGSAEGNLGARRRTLWDLGETPEGPRRDSECVVGVTLRGIWRRTAGTAGATLRLWRQH